MQIDIAFKLKLHVVITTHALLLLVFWGGGGDKLKKNLPWRGLGIFWNNTENLGLAYDAYAFFTSMLLHWCITDPTCYLLVLILRSHLHQNNGTHIKMTNRYKYNK